MITLEQLQAGIVIPIDKPRQWTSFQAVNKIKAVVRNTYGLKKFKIGHAGTLDPLATGLLLVCIGKATKTIPQLQDGDKVYTGTMVLGATTPCYDLERPIDQYYPYEHITLEMLNATVGHFVGEIEQVPPMFSAVKIDGQRAYEIARVENGERRMENEEPRAKQVTIHSFEITAFRKNQSTQFTLNNQNTQITPTLPTSHLYQNPLGEVPPHLPQADFRIHCGKGTYIRSLARDLGLALGSGAFLSDLRREKVGPYTFDQAITLDQVESFLKGSSYC